jgi:hypothetical protein
LIVDLTLESGSNCTIAFGFDFQHLNTRANKNNEWQFVQASRRVRMKNAGLSPVPLLVDAQGSPALLFYFTLSHSPLLPGHSTLSC